MVIHDVVRAHSPPDLPCSAWQPTGSVLNSPFGERRMMKTILMLIVVAALTGCRTDTQSTTVAPRTRPKLEIIAMHPVQKGETLSSICRKYYGRSDHDMLVLVSKANPEILAESTGSPQPHMTLRIPALQDKEK